MISRNVIIFKMNDDLNYNLSILDIQNNYFEGELKDNDGMYLVPGVKDNYKADDKISNDDTILFLYRNMFIATAKIKKDSQGKHYHKLTKEIKGNWKLDHKKEKEEWEYKAGCEFKSYFQFKNIKKLPPLPRENLNEFFIEKINTRSSIKKVTLKEEYIEKFLNYLNSKKSSTLLKPNAWKIIKYLNAPAVMKEISLYSYENIHTSFFCNFISESNVYGFKKEPFIKFIKLLKQKATGKNAEILNNIKDIDNFNVIPQKFYFNENNEKIIPDISIVVNEKYTIIVEGKVCAEERVYKEEIKQCQYYHDTLEEENRIFVFLTMRNRDTQENEDFIKITFKDIYKEVYSYYYDYYKNKPNILYEYLKSFCYFCNKEKFDFKIDEIPPINFNDIESKLIKHYKDLREDIYNIANYKLIGNIDKKNLVFYKYILVLLYNMENFKDDRLMIEKCYNNLN